MRAPASCAGVRPLSEQEFVDGTVPSHQLLASISYSAAILVVKHRIFSIPNNRQATRTEFMVHESTRLPSTYSPNRTVSIITLLDTKSTRSNREFAASREAASEAARCAAARRSDAISSSTACRRAASSCFVASICFLAAYSMPMITTPLTFLVHHWGFFSIIHLSFLPLLQLLLLSIGRRAVFARWQLVLPVFQHLLFPLQATELLLLLVSHIDAPSFSLDSATSPK